jgi:hypothetical protein
MYQELFDEVIRFVREKNCHEIDYHEGTPYSIDDIKRMEDTLGCEAPLALKEYWQEMGYNSGLRWIFADSEESAAANFVIHGPNEIIEYHAYSVEQHHRLIQDNVLKNPKGTRVSARRALKYFNVIAEGNGDLIAIDAETDFVVFNDHEWECDNGYVMGDNFYDFMKKWSLVCWQIPRSLGWWECSGIHGINFNSPEFDAKFKRSRFIW